jgi:hypothetical protein
MMGRRSRAVQHRKLAVSQKQVASSLAASSEITDAGNAMTALGDASPAALTDASIHMREMTDAARIRRDVLREAIAAIDNIEGHGAIGGEVLARAIKVIEALTTQPVSEEPQASDAAHPEGAP